MSNKSKQCEKACGTCPWLKANLNKPNPENFEKIKDSEPEYEYFDWYSEKNLARLWSKGLRKGELMLCHSSDSTAENYGGKNAKPGIEKLCVGSIMLVLQHVHFLQEQGKDLKRAERNKLYREIAGKYPMTQQGFANWISYFFLGRTNLFGGLTVPRQFEIEDLKKISVPWNDGIILGNKDGENGGK